MVPLSGFKGKVVLLDFWATECGGCRIEIPWYMEFDTKYRAKGLAVVGVSMDVWFEQLRSANQVWMKVRPFVHENRAGYSILMSDESVGKAYDILALPITALIDKKGRIAATYANGLADRSDMEANIRTLLKER
jgi:thiol-disulfide isomerase/thioredoxin